jgi:methyltransferase OMS1
VAAGFLGVLGYFGAETYIVFSQPVPEFDPSINLNDVYNTTAKEFDEKVGREEYWYGIYKLRRRIAGMADGDVLESAAGTGRNSKFFKKPEVGSIVLVDKSESMLDICKEKWKESSEDEHNWNGNVAFWVADLAEDGVEKRISPPNDSEKGATNSGKFDTVIQTFGLCSTNEPVNLLRNLGKLVKEDGKILLLEHGRGYWDWENKYLDVVAPTHAKRHGCWFNRDIGAIVEESGLEIVKMERYTLGTTWWFELKRPANYAEPAETIETNLAETPSIYKPWWWFWR